MCTGFVFSVYDQPFTSAVKVIADQVQGRDLAHADLLLNTLTHSKFPKLSLLFVFENALTDLKQRVGFVSVPRLVGLTDLSHAY